MNNLHINQRDALKEYVQKHPHNKMAWYLLGKDYAEHGEIAKAKYCYIRAGEVYEAYEDIPLPDIKVDRPLDKSDNPLRESSRKSRSSMRQSWKWMLAWLAMVLLLVQTDHAADNSESKLAAAAANSNSQSTATGMQSSAAHGEEPILKKPQTVVHYAEGNLSTIKRQSDLVSPILSEVMDGALTALLVQAPPVGTKWKDWQAEPKLLFSAEKTTDRDGAYKLSEYDKQLCSCEPGDSSQAKQQFNAWKSEEEQRMIVRSALKGYQSITGKLPESVEQLTQDYPNNFLSGLTPLMRAAAEEVINDPSSPTSTIEQQPNLQQSQSAAPQSISSTDLLSGPLQIIVDKSTHRLALVSGNMIVRSYPVGLGGNRTPEGEFTISEKVRNPNGRDNGEFGSRGMTLSDTLFAIHGTNQPTSIGSDRSLGCVRMLKGDVEELFDMVPMGTKVTIGTGLLPADILRSKSPFSLPVEGNETNPTKVYRWLT